MVKQNIKVAIIAIVSFITFWLILFNFIKIDVSSQGVISFVESTSYIAIDSKTGAYIQNHEIDYVKIEYNHQYFSSHITYSSGNDEYTYYCISLPQIIEKTESYILTNVVADSLNVYQYLFKK